MVRLCAPSPCRPPMSNRDFFFLTKASKSVVELLQTELSRLYKINREFHGDFFHRDLDGDFLG